MLRFVDKSEKSQMRREVVSVLSPNLSSVTYWHVTLGE